MTRLAVIGATGQLGSEVVRAFREAGGYAVVGLSHGEVECTDPGSVLEAIVPLGPEVVVNCAAFVRVDACEDDPKRAFEVNTLGALHVARACREIGARCVYLSTDYVFDGAKPDPYTEDDAPNPINVYGASKLAGELLVRQTCPDALIVRVASLFGGRGARGKGSNFVLTVLERAHRGEPLHVVSDIRMSPTYAWDAAKALVGLVQQEAKGVFHVVNQGECSWYEFARTIVRLAGLAASVEPTSQASYPTKARRPANSALSTAKLAAAGLVLRPWEEAVADYVARLAGLPAKPHRPGGRL